MLELEPPVLEPPVLEPPVPPVVEPEFPPMAAPPVPVLDEELELVDELEDDVPVPVELWVLVVGVVGVVGVLGVLAVVSSCCAIVVSPVGGTTSGLVLGSAAISEPPPQLASTVAMATVLSSNEAWRLIRTVLLGERRHAAAARRALVEVALRHGTAVRAQSQGRDRPREVGLRWCKGEHLADNLQRLARHLIVVDEIGVGFKDELAATGGRAKPVTLLHGSNPTKAGGCEPAVSYGAGR